MKDDDLNKGHVKIIFLPVVALSFPFFCPKLEQALHTNNKNSIPDMLVIFFFEKDASKYLNMQFYVVSDQLCNANGPPAQVQRDELVTQLSF